MKKIYKHLGIVFVMAFAILIGCFSNNVFAADDGEVGTANLNNTTENSAKVGDVLTHPEKGWKRYGAYGPNINFTGSWHFYGTKESGKYDNGSTLGMAETAEFGEAPCPTGSTLKFNFTGNKLRLLFWYSIPDRNSTKVKIQINNSEPIYVNTRQYAPSHYSLVYENENLKNENCVEITNLDSYQFCFDGVDIDENGQLKPYNENLENITLNKSTDSLQVGKTDTLTATVTPDNETNKNVTWTSSDPTIAEVDQTGKVKANKEGTATITATTTDGSNLSATCVVTVIPKSTTPTNPTDNTGNAILTITMTNGNVKSYTVSMSKVNDFISWYNNRSAGSNGSPYYAFDKTDNLQPFSKKTEYVVFDKISSFEVDEYTKQ